MITLQDLYNALQSLAPFDLQEDYDNAGIIVGLPQMKVKGVVISLDATPAVIEEAISKGCNVVVSHHPIVFRGLKRFNGSNYVEKAVMTAIKKDVALIAIHTNLDNVLDNGVNTQIAQKLGIRDFDALRPKVSDHTDYDTGSGLIGYLDEPMGTMTFLKMVKLKMKAEVLKYTAITCPQVHKVAVCGGSGRFLLEDAIKRKADVFITSDVKYHEYFDADEKIILADIGHYESEQFTIDLIYEFITKNFSNFASHYTKVNTNPVKYL
jgi:dinuclear metal center YbgI/SA1388 family protein